MIGWVLGFAWGIYVGHLGDTYSMPWVTKITLCLAPWAITAIIIAVTVRK